MFAWWRYWTMLLSYVKLFLPSFSDSVKFWSSMSCINLSFELVDKKLWKYWQLFRIATFTDSSFILQKSTKAQNKHFDVKELCMEFRATVDVWFRVSCGTIIKKTRRLSTLKFERNWTIFSKWMAEDKENLEDYVLPKIQDIVVSTADEEIRVCLRFPFPCKTKIHFAEPPLKSLKCLVF